MITVEDLETLKPPECIEVPTYKPTLLTIAEYLSSLETLEKKTDKNIELIEIDHKYNDYLEYCVKKLIPRCSHYYHLKKNTNFKPSDFNFSSYNDNLPIKQLEILKSTALFCARNQGRNYISRLQKTYLDNPYFQFLNPSNKLNRSFNSFINQYEKLISGEYKKVLEVGKDYKHKILSKAFRRAQYNEQEEVAKQRKDNEHEKMKVKFAAIEWNKHEVIGKFNVEEKDITENLPTAIDFSELKKCSLTKNFCDIFISHEKTAPTKQKLKKKQVTVKAAGETRIKRKLESSQPNMIQCPITNKMIAEKQFQKHLNILLTDPNYKSEREKYKAANKLKNITCENVYQNIKKVLDLDQSPNKQHKKN